MSDRDDLVKAVENAMENMYWQDGKAVSPPPSTEDVALAAVIAVESFHQDESKPEKNAVDVTVTNGDAVLSKTQVFTESPRLTNDLIVSLIGESFCLDEEEFDALHRL